MGTITFNITGGLPPFTAELIPSVVPPLTGLSLGQHTFLDVPDGTYDLLVTDAMDCEYFVTDLETDDCVLCCSPTNLFEYAVSSVVVGSLMFVGDNREDPHIVRFNDPDNLTNYTILTISGVEGIKSACYSAITGKAYFSARDSFTNNVCIIEVDPNTLAFTKHDIVGILGDNCRITGDDTYIYGSSFSTADGETTFFKITIATWVVDSYTFAGFAPPTAICVDPIREEMYVASDVTLNSVAIVSTNDLSSFDVGNDIIDVSTFVNSPSGIVCYNGKVAVAGISPVIGYGAAVIDVDTLVVTGFSLMPSYGLWLDGSKVYSGCFLEEIDVFDIGNPSLVVTSNIDAGFVASQILFAGTRVFLTKWGDVNNAQLCEYVCMPDVTTTSTSTSTSTSTTTSTTTLCVRPTTIPIAFIPSWYMTGYGWNDFSGGTLSEACDEFTTYTGLPFTFGSVSYFEAEVEDFAVGEQVYLNYGSSECNCFPDGVYWVGTSLPSSVDGFTTHGWVCVYIVEVKSDYDGGYNCLRSYINDIQLCCTIPTTTTTSTTSEPTTTTTSTTEEPTTTTTTTEEPTTTTTSTTVEPTTTTTTTVCVRDCFLEFTLWKKIYYTDLSELDIQGMTLGDACIALWENCETKTPISGSGGPVEGCHMPPEVGDIIWYGWNTTDCTTFPAGVYLYDDCSPICNSYNCHEDCYYLVELDANGVVIDILICCAPTTTTSTTEEPTTTTTSTTVEPSTTTTTTCEDCTTTTTTTCEGCTTTTTTAEPTTTTTTIEPTTTTTTTLEPTTTTTSTTVSPEPQECDDIYSVYIEQASYPLSVDYTVGADVKCVYFDYKPYDIPDRFIVYFDGNVVVDTGYVGDATAYAVGGTDRGTFITAVDGLVDPITGHTYPNYGDYPLDGYPDVTDNGGSTTWSTTYFVKSTATTVATVRVYSPMDTTEYDIVVHCPQTCPTTTTTTTLCEGGLDILEVTFPTTTTTSSTTAYCEPPTASPNTEAWLFRPVCDYSYSIIPYNFYGFYCNNGGDLSKIRIDYAPIIGELLYNGVQVISGQELTVLSGNDFEYDLVYHADETVTGDYQMMIVFSILCDDCATYSTSSNIVYTVYACVSTTTTTTTAPPTTTTTTSSSSTTTTTTTNAIPVSYDNEMNIYRSVVCVNEHQELLTVDFPYTDVDGGDLLYVQIVTKPSVGTLRYNGNILTGTEILTVEFGTDFEYTLEYYADDDTATYYEDSFTFRVRTEGRVEYSNTSTVYLHVFACGATTTTSTSTSSTTTTTTTCVRPPCLQEAFIAAWWDDGWYVISDKLPEEGCELFDQFKATPLTGNEYPSYWEAEFEAMVEGNIAYLGYDNDSCYDFVQDGYYWYNETLDKDPSAADIHALSCIYIVTVESGIITAISEACCPSTTTTTSTLYPVPGDCYGLLYNRFAVTNAKGIAPSGWHVPTDAEWTTLTDYLGTKTDDFDNPFGYKLKETGTTYWNSPNTSATNEVNFFARGGGSRLYTDASYVNINQYANFWSSTVNYSDYYWSRQLYYNQGIIHRGYADPENGFSVRLLKDDSDIGNGTMTDYDGNIYGVVNINGQVWMMENLKVQHYSDGTLIPNIIDDATWLADTDGALCSYDDVWDNGCDFAYTTTSTSTTAEPTTTTTSTTEESTTTTTTTCEGCTTTTTSSTSTSTTTSTSSTTTTSTTEIPCGECDPAFYLDNSLGGLNTRLINNPSNSYQDITLAALKWSDYAYPSCIGIPGNPNWMSGNIHYEIHINADVTADWGYNIYFYRATYNSVIIEQGGSLVDFYNSDTGHVVLSGDIYCTWTGGSDTDRLILLIGFGTYYTPAVFRIYEGDTYSSYITANICADATTTTSTTAYAPIAEDSEITVERAACSPYVDEPITADLFEYTFGTPVRKIRFVAFTNMHLWSGTDEIEEGTELNVVAGEFGVDVHYEWDVEEQPAYSVSFTFQVLCYGSDTWSNVATFTINVEACPPPNANVKMVNVVLNHREEPEYSIYTGILRVTTDADLHNASVGFYLDFNGVAEPSGPSELGYVQQGERRMTTMWIGGDTWVRMGEGVIGTYTRTVYYAGVTDVNFILIHKNDNWSSPRFSSPFRVYLVEHDIPLFEPIATYTNNTTHVVNVNGIMTTFLLVRGPVARDSGISGEIIFYSMVREPGHTYTAVNGYKDITFKELFYTDGYDAERRFIELWWEDVGIDFPPYWEGNWVTAGYGHQYYNYTNDSYYDEGVSYTNFPTLSNPAASAYTRYYLRNQSDDTSTFDYKIRGHLYCEVFIDYSEDISKLITDKNIICFDPEIPTFARSVYWFSDILYNIKVIPGAETLLTTDRFFFDVVAHVLDEGTTVYVKKYGGHIYQNYTYLYLSDGQRFTVDIAGSGIEGDDMNFRYISVAHDPTVPSDMSDTAYYERAYAGVTGIQDGGMYLIALASIGDHVPDIYTYTRNYIEIIPHTVGIDGQVTTVPALFPTYWGYYGPSIYPPF